MFWSNAAGGYDALATPPTSGAFQAMVPHFSGGVLGTVPLLLKLKASEINEAYRVLSKSAA